MLRYILLGTIAYTGMAFIVPDQALAQDTEQTDQSEEDWRKSQRKRKSNDDFDPITNPQGLGTGISLPPLEPIDTLPEDSRRHLQRQRAKVIAEMEFGEDLEDVAFEPSEAAKQDPGLAAEEEEAWEVILTDLQGGPGGDQQGQGGPNKVAVAGQGGGAPSSVTRGGSSQSAADILAQLKGLQGSGNGRGATGDGASPAPQSTQQGGGQSTQAGDQQGQAQPPQSPGQQAGQPQSQTDGQTDGQSPQQNTPPPTGTQQDGQASEQSQQGNQPQAPESVTRGGSTGSVADILSGIRGDQSGSGSDGQAQQGDGSSAQQGEQGQQSQSQSNGQSPQQNTPPPTGTQQDGQASEQSQQGNQPQAPESVTRGGSTGSVADILSGIRGDQSGSGSDGQAQQGDGSSAQQGEQGQQSQSQSNGQGQSASQSEGQDQGNGQDGSDAGDGAEDGGQKGAANNRQPFTPTVDPLNIPDRPSTVGKGDGSKSSASEYLKVLTGDQEPEPEDTDN